MLSLEILPLVGIGPARFGEHRDAVRAAFAGVGVALKREQQLQDYFFGGAIQVEDEDDYTASFVGVTSSSELRLYFAGVDLFDAPATEVFSTFALRDGSGIHRFSRRGYIFPSQILTLYEADTQYDRRSAEGRSVWGQVGAGDERYLAAIIQIRKGQLNPVSEKDA